MTVRPDLGDFAWAPRLCERRAERGGPTITAIVHTRNEERNLPDALRSLAWVDHVLVVDMESEDATVAIARAHGAEVLSVPNAGYVEPARNTALDAADGDWILVVDADERVPERLATVLDELARSGAADVAQIHWHTWIAGRFLTASGWMDNFHTRFFRRGCVRWSDRIHALPEITGEAVRVRYTPETALVHFNYDDLAHFVTKLNRYTDKEADAHEGEPVMGWAELAPILRTNLEWHWTPEQDGPLSSVLAISMAFYRFMVQAKRWERAGFPEVGVPAAGRDALRDLAHDGRALHAQGLAAAADGRAEEAAGLLRRSVAEQLDLDTLNDLAVLLAQTGRGDEARAVLHTCLAIDPDCGAAAENLAALEGQTSSTLAE